MNWRRVEPGANEPNSQKQKVRAVFMGTISSFGPKEIENDSESFVVSFRATC